MIAGDYHHMATAQSRYATEKPVIQFLSKVAGRTVVKDISGNKKYIDLLSRYEIRPPVQKCLEFLVSLAIIKSTADMPIGCMQNFHLFPFLIRNSGRNRISV